MLRLLTDENFKGDIIRGLRLQRATLDLMRVQDVGLLTAEDPDILDWAADHHRILLTHDRATIPDFAYHRIIQGNAMPGVFVFHNRIPIRQAVEEILFLDDCTQTEDWVGQVVYLPL